MPWVSGTGVAGGFFGCSMRLSIAAIATLIPCSAAAALVAANCYLPGIVRDVLQRHDVRKLPSGPAAHCANRTLHGHRHM